MRNEKELIRFNKKFDWREINQDDINEGAGSIYGNALVPGNYVCEVFNQNSPTKSAICWIVTGCHIYSDTYKIANVANNLKDIKDAEISRTIPSYQKICDYLGSPDAKYLISNDRMRNERNYLKKNGGSINRGGDFNLFCNIFNNCWHECT